MGKSKEIQMDIREIRGKGRGVVVTQQVPAGTFVVEYKTTKVYPKSKREQHEAEYSLNDEPCMILEVQTPNGWHCLDATRRFQSLGRLMNHAPPDKATAKPFRPQFVRGKWRVGFLTTKDLEPGTELTWNYGCPPGGQEWLMRREVS